jgi:DnaJ-class molecular chaperone
MTSRNGNEEPVPGHQNWVEEDCQVCEGKGWVCVEESWTGQTRTCTKCKGVGSYCRHVISNVIARSPGGNFL